MRRYFHKCPEISFNEYKTAEKIEKELDSLGIYHKRIGETGIIGVIRGKGKGEKIIALRADIDALNIKDLKNVNYKSQIDGVCHACGHDAHMASLLGAAKILKSKENEISGEIRLFFQQAEEIGQGARVFVNSGCLDGVTSIFGVHVDSAIDVGNVAIIEGPICAACDYFKINVKGKSAHVANPHLAVDALYVTSQIVVALQGIVSRNISPNDTVVLGIGIMNSGTAYNAIAGEGTLEGTIRTFNIETREKVIKLVKDISKNIAEAYGATVEVEVKKYTPVLINDKSVISDIRNVAKDIIGEEKIIINRNKSLGGDDFAEYLLKIPGAYVQVGSKNKKNPNTSVPHHNEYFDIDENAILIATNLEVEYVLKNLSIN